MRHLTVSMNSGKGVSVATIFTSLIGRPLVVSYLYWIYTIRMRIIQGSYELGIVPANMTESILNESTCDGGMGYE